MSKDSKGVLTDYSYTQNRELSWLRFNERAAAELLEQACALMAQAKSCHDELETYYRTAVDFAQVDAAAAQCMELFGVG